MSCGMERHLRGDRHGDGREDGRRIRMRSRESAGDIGQGISQCCFEVGMEVAEDFAENWTFAEDYITRTPEDMVNGKCHIDIKGINQEQLELMGIPTDQIRVSEHCTCCEPELFCSYRREGGTYMRMGGGRLHEGKVEKFRCVRPGSMS